jgi:hypothetical protein
MKELIRTNDAVLLSYIEVLLKGARIPHQVADTHMSILDGSVGILPRRVLVADEDHAAARRIVGAADIELPSDETD